MSTTGAARPRPPRSDVEVARLRARDFLRAVPQGDLGALRVLLGLAA